MAGNEKRLHRRISGILSERSSIEISGQRFPIRNLSYGGFAAKLSEESHAALNHQEEIKLVLNVLGRGVETEAKIVNRVNDITGFSIVHSGVDALMFLRGIFEFWQNGTTAMIVASNQLLESSSGKNKLYLSGDGPTDIILSEEEDSTFSKVIITYMNDGDYSQIDYEKGQFKSGKAFGESKTPEASIRTDAELDFKTLRQTACILAGIEIPSMKERIDELLKIWVDRLN